MKIAICGSMAFAKEMLEAKETLVQKGHQVATPHNIESYADGTISIENKLEKIENDLIKKHYGKIKESDAILVQNYSKNGVENYIGGNSLLEMGFAHVLDKKIFLLNPIPVMSYSDEIEAMAPIVLDGEVSKLV